jgi:hypothetical protein
MSSVFKRRLLEQSKKKVKKKVKGVTPVRNMIRRDYKREIFKYYGYPKVVERVSPLQQRHRREKTARGIARRLLLGDIPSRNARGSGKDVDHRDHNPLNNAKSNLRLISIKANRSDNKRKEATGGSRVLPGRRRPKD